LPGAPRAKEAPIGVLAPLLVLAGLSIWFGLDASLPEQLAQGGCGAPVRGAAMNTGELLILLALGRAAVRGGCDLCGRPHAGCARDADARVRASRLAVDRHLDLRACRRWRSRPS
jgi:hypothetical protein